MVEGVKDDGTIIVTTITITTNASIITTITSIITTIVSIITPIAIIITIFVDVLHQMRPAQFNRIVLQPNNHIDPTMMMMMMMMMMMIIRMQQERILNRASMNKLMIE